MHVELITTYEFGKLNRAFLPVGTLEAHGPAPLGTDNIIPLKICEELSKHIEGYILPVVSYGINRSLKFHPGSIGVSESTFKSFIYDIASSLKFQGIEQLIVVNGHGGNTQALKQVLYRIHDELGMKVILAEWWNAIDSREFFGEDVGHAGLDEVSLVAVALPEIQKKIRKFGKVKALAYNSGLTTIYPRPYSILPSFKNEMDYSKLSMEKARAFFKEVVERLRRSIEEVVYAWEKEDKHA